MSYSAPSGRDDGAVTPNPRQARAQETMNPIGFQSQQCKRLGPLWRLSARLVLIVASISGVLAVSARPLIASVPAIEFQRFKLIDGFPYAQFSLVNPTDNRIWFLTMDGQDPAYRLEVRTKKMKWQDASPGFCGLTQFKKTELPAHGSHSFIAEVPVLASVFRVNLPIYKSQGGREEQLASPPVTAPADLVRPPLEEPVVPPDEFVAPKVLARMVPEYPEVAMRAGIEGTVVLRVVVGPSGAVDNIQVMKGNPILATAAVKAAKTWRYSPISWRGEPASAILTEKVAFRLKDHP